MVLREIGDDYEEIDHILVNLRKVCAQIGVPVSRHDVYEALNDLFDKELAGAYRLSPSSPVTQVYEMPKEDELDVSSYFLISDDGLRVLRSEFEYPLDDEGVLRSDWVPPSQ